jgi:hypothetical protein
MLSSLVSSKSSNMARLAMAILEQSVLAPLFEEL